MIGRAAGYVAAAAFAGCVLTGIGALIVADLFGEDALSKLWQSVTVKPPPVPTSATILDGAKNITFFAEVEAKEHGLVVITGVTFETVKDFETSKQRNRWCYVMATRKGGLPRQISLAKQEGTAVPIYSDLSVYTMEELSAVGLTARTLQALAKSHCRFAKTNARTMGAAFGGRA